MQWLLTVWKKSGWTKQSTSTHKQAYTSSEMLQDAVTASQSMFGISDDRLIRWPVVSLSPSVQSCWNTQTSCLLHNFLSGYFRITCIDSFCRKKLPTTVISQTFMFRKDTNLHFFRQESSNIHFPSFSSYFKELYTFSFLVLEVCKLMSVVHMTSLPRVWECTGGTGYCQDAPQHLNRFFFAGIFSGGMMEMARLWRRARLMMTLLTSFWRIHSTICTSWTSVSMYVSCRPSASLKARSAVTWRSLPWHTVPTSTALMWSGAAYMSRLLNLQKKKRNPHTFKNISFSG